MMTVSGSLFNFFQDAPNQSNWLELVRFKPFGVLIMISSLDTVVRVE